MEVALPHKLLALPTLLTLLTLHNVHIVQFEFLVIEQTETYQKNCGVIYYLAFYIFGILNLSSFS